MTRALSAFSEKSQRVLLAGPPGIWINANTSLLLTMALHELVTNAIKYGALSNTSGQVNVHWELLESASRLRLTWEESGAPAVAPPHVKGFGSFLLERALAAEAGGACFEFRPHGVTCTLELAL